MGALFIFTLRNMSTEEVQQATEASNDSNLGAGMASVTLMDP